MKTRLSRFKINRRTVAAVAVGAVLVSSGSLALAQAANAQVVPQYRAQTVRAGIRQSETFTYTGTSQVFSTPPYASEVQVSVTGGSGGSGQGFGGAYGGSPGYAGTVTADLSTAGVQELDVWVGSAGGTPGLSGAPGGSSSGAGADGGTGGIPDTSTFSGAGGGGGGGAASEITDLGGNALVVAGGGGGSGGGGSLPNYNGGNGGDGSNPPASGTSGGGLGVGGGGTGGASGFPAGSAGGEGLQESLAGGGGGGGGGYEGGQGGGGGGTGEGGGGGGGAGQSYVTPSALASSFSVSSAYGNGSITFYWTGPAPVSVGLVSNANPALQGQPIDFTATVAPPAGDPAPTGTVRLYNLTNNNKLLASKKLTAADQGIVSFTLSHLARGLDQLYASYSGNSNYEPTVGNVLNEQILNVTATLSKTTINFGRQKVGVQASRQVTLTNKGDGILLITQVGYDNPAFVFNHGTCTAETGAGQSCTFLVLFTAPQLGLTSGHLYLYTNAPKSPEVITVSGTGV